MDFSTSVGILAFIFAIPMAIVGNLLTPGVGAWWATTNEKRRQRRIKKLELELKRLRDKARSSLAAPVKLKGPKQPVLEFSDITSVGMGDRLARQLGFNAPEGIAFFVRNSEQRFPTRAHNLKASVTLRSADDKQIHVENAPWFQNLSTVAPGSYFKQSVTVGMLEKAGVVCAIKCEANFYTAIHDTETGPKTGQQLAYGDWYLELHIEGDNILQDYGGKLQFLPNGSYGFTPPQSA